MTSRLFSKKFTDPRALGPAPHDLEPTHVALGADLIMGHLTAALSALAPETGLTALHPDRR